MLWAWSQKFWSQSVMAEVYTLHTALCMVYLICLFYWSLDCNPKWFYRSAFVVGLGLTNHHLTLMFLPPLAYQGLWTALTQKKTRFAPLCLKGLLSFGLPLLIYLYLPIRSFMDVSFDWGKTQTWDTFLAHITRRQYGAYKEEIVGLKSLIDARFWNWKTWESYFHHLTKQYTWLWPAALLGIAVLFRKQKRLFFPISFIFFFGTLWLWANIRANPYSHYLHDLFLLSGELPLMLSLGWGLLWILNRVGRTKIGIVTMSAAVLFIPIGMARANWPMVSRHGDYIVHDFHTKILQALPKNAIYFLYGDTNTSVSLYLRLVENQRPDILFLDYNAGQAFRETPSNWGPSKDPENEATGLYSIGHFIWQVKDPVFISYLHPIIGVLSPYIVPFGPLAHFDSGKDRKTSWQSFQQSGFPWAEFQLRGIEKPIAFSDYWNWATIADCLLGRIFEKFGYSGLETIDPFARVLLLDAETWRESGGLSLLYVCQNRFEDALNEQYRITVAHPKEPAHFYNLGLLYVAAGQKENALLLWRKALELHPNWPTAKEAISRLEASR